MICFSNCLKIFNFFFHIGSFYDKGEKRYRIKLAFELPLLTSFIRILIFDKKTGWRFSYKVSLAWLFLHKKQALYSADGCISNRRLNQNKKERKKL